MPVLIGVALIGTIGVVAAGSQDVRKGISRFFSSSHDTLIPYIVKKQKLVITVVERGDLKSAQNTDVINEVEGQTTILWILPEGSRVQEGDKVCELDSAALRDNLVNQEIATKRAEADFENAKKTREVAEIAVQEYKEGTYKQDYQNIQGEITLAKSEMERAKDRLGWSERMFENKYVSESQVIADRLAEIKAEISQAQAERKMDVLTRYTYKKQVTELEANVEKARSDELAKEQTFQLEQAKLEKLRKQIDKTVLYAPGEGLIVYANDSGSFRGNNQPLVEEGAVVRERQKIFSIPDIDHMQVDTKVHESMVDRIEPGQRARIRVDAFPSVGLTGTVQKVQPLPDQTSFFSSDIKVYTTIVTIDQTFTALRPGMTAEVTIYIDTLEDVLCIPVTAVLPMQDKDYVYVLTPEGPERREVKLGETNDILIEIKEGLQENERVAMNPGALLSEDERREAFSASARADARAKDFSDLKNSGGSQSPGMQGESGGEAKQGGEARRKGRGEGGPGGGGGGPGGMMGSPEDREKFMSASREERRQMLQDRGIPADRVDSILDRMEQGGGPDGSRGEAGGPGGSDGPRGEAAGRRGGFGGERGGGGPGGEGSRRRGGGRPGGGDSQ